MEDDLSLLVSTLLMDLEEEDGDLLELAPLTGLLMTAYFITFSVELIKCRSSGLALLSSMPLSNNLLDVSIILITSSLLLGIVMSSIDGMLVRESE